MAEHTPGPWRVTGESRRWICAPMIDGLEGGSVAFAVLIDGSETDEVRANARLIAAAPELLAALKAIIETANPDRLPNYGEDARVAIAKAAGPK